MTFPYSLLDDGMISQLKDMAGVPRRGPLNPRGLFEPLDIEPMSPLMADLPAPGMGDAVGAGVRMPNNPSLRQRAVGRVRNLLGFDNFGEYEELLTPEQKKRARPSLLGGVLTTLLSVEPPSHQAQRRAGQVLAGSQAAEQVRTQREMEEGRKALVASIDWQKPGAERLFIKGLLRLGANPKEMAQAFQDFEPPTERDGATPLGNGFVWNRQTNRVERLDVPEKAAAAPSRVNTAQGIQEWNPQTGKYEWVLDENERKVMPFAQPVQPSFSVPAGLTGPNGRPLVFNNKTGRMEEAPEGTDRSVGGASQSERALAAGEAERSFRQIVGPDGKLLQPPNWLDRAATQRDFTNAFASKEGQAYMTNVRNLIRSWAIVVEGKRMSDADARANEMLKSFRFGAGAEADEDTKRRLEGMAADIRDTTGGRVPGSGGRGGAPAGFTDAQVAEAMANGATTTEKVRAYWAGRRP